MKKLLSLVLILIILLQPITITADNNNAGYEGGIHKNEKDIKDTKQYKEVIFLTGQPIVLEGTVEITIKKDKLEYEYELSNLDGTVTLDREIELDRRIDNTSHQTQTTEINSITGYDEEIIINGDAYSLTDYIFHASSINDSQPVVDFYYGIWPGTTKIYSINGGPAKITEEIIGEIYGYDHYWGATETQKIHRDISYKEETTQGITEWFGFADIYVSFNRTKKMDYFNNLPFQTSFNNGYILTEKEESIMSYDYDLPVIDATNTPTGIRNQGHGEAIYSTSPTTETLFIPKYQDIKGHWAENNIMRISSLKITNQSQQFFGPDLATQRVDFARWIAVVMDLVEETETVNRSYTKPDETPPIFSDIPKDSPDYEYIKAIKERGIMNGVGADKFSPYDKLTRAQAITTLVRAMGLEHLAPTLPFETRFEDDDNIPAWAKRAIYVADKIGLTTGSPEGYMYPNDYMTKAESATFMNRFINYLQEDLKRDYIQNIINYY